MKNHLDQHVHDVSIFAKVQMYISSSQNIAN